MPRFVGNGEPYLQRGVTPMQGIVLKSMYENKNPTPASPTKSIYDLVKQDIKMPEGLLFRGKYVGKTRNTLGYENTN